MESNWPYAQKSKVTDSQRRYWNVIPRARDQEEGQEAVKEESDSKMWPEIWINMDRDQEVGPG